MKKILLIALLAAFASAAIMPILGPTAAYAGVSQDDQGQDNDDQGQDQQ